ncbi:peptidase family m28 domain-containing protein [Ditylenchus destructor]|uniref:BOS complex subunit NCLN n=1 Tax=Ditylenchus destructor TaxID=166010 RepID=A0AAD4R975_9BILA|nr:peptidase family m28 domain-containing protein [Ditylenchus destructor]
MQEEFFDAFRHIFVFLWIWSFFPCIYVMGSSLVTDKSTEIEIRAFRLQQYEYAGKQIGSKNWRVTYEAVSLNGSALRKCMIVSWRDLIHRELETTIGAAVGAILVIIPEKLDSLVEKEIQEFQMVEKKFADFRTEQAVYFVPKRSDSIDYLMQSVAIASKRAPSAVQSLYNAVASNNFHITSSSTATANVASPKNYNIIGQLNAGERGRPYLLIVAHYDTHSILPGYGKGVDSNGSGMAALLELLAILSRFYSDPANRPKLNIVFLLSAAGKYNYQGARQYIEEFQERRSDESIVHSLCLDSLAGGNALNFHVAKAPTEGSSAAYKILQHLKNFANKDRPVRVVTKKINLSAERLAWEHEMFNKMRVHSATISHFENHANPMRTSLLDTRSNIDESVFVENVQVIANALVSFAYDLDSSLCAGSNKGCSLLSKGSGVERNRLLAWLDTFTSSPRPAAATQTKLVADLNNVVERYAHKTTVSEVNMVDFVLYDIFDDKLVANIVKPAIFELFLAAIIGVYLFAVYQLSLNAQTILDGTVTKLRKFV